MAGQPVKLPSGRKSRHGGFNYPTLESPKDRLALERYLFVIRESYIKDLTNGTGEDSLTTGQLILLDTLVMLKAINRTVEIRAAEEASIKPFDERYNARNNQVIRICQLLSIEPDEHERFVTADEQAEIIRADLKDKKEKEANGS